MTNPMMTAVDKVTVRDWMGRVERGEICLPRFQRGMVWTPDHAAKFLTSLVRGYPTGALLVLERGSSDLFLVRGMEGATEELRPDAPYLLDGQQRLTSLWHGLTGSYRNRLFMVYKRKGVHRDAFRVEAVPAASKLLDWDDHDQAWVRELPDDDVWCFPVKLLHPDRVPAEIDHFAFQARPDTDEAKALANEIRLIAETVQEMVLPVQVMSADTPRGEAIDVFINTNTSAVKVKPWDILVAMYEGEMSRLLPKDLDEATIDHDNQHLRRYAKTPQQIREKVVAVLCMLQGKEAGPASYTRLSMESVKSDRRRAARGLAQAVTILSDMGVYSQSEVPHWDAVYAAAAMLASPPRGVDRSTLDTVLRRYLWRAFLTERYLTRPASRSVEDRMAIASALEASASLSDAPIFQDRYAPLITQDHAFDEIRPESPIGKAVLLAVRQAGERSLADGVAAGPDNAAARSTHYVFTASYLEGLGYYQQRAQSPVNCIRLPAPVPKEDGLALDPRAYLQSVCGVSFADQPDADMRILMESHMIDADLLVKPKHVQPSNWYERFINDRWQRIEAVIRSLCGDNGQSSRPHSESEFSDN